MGRKGARRGGEGGSGEVDGSKCYHPEGQNRYRLPNVSCVRYRLKHVGRGSREGFTADTHEVPSYYMCYTLRYSVSSVVRACGSVTKLGKETHHKAQTHVGTTWHGGAGESPRVSVSMIGRPATRALHFENLWLKFPGGQFATGQCTRRPHAHDASTEIGTKLKRKNMKHRQEKTQLVVDIQGNLEPIHKVRVHMIITSCVKQVNNSW